MQLGPLLSFRRMRTLGFVSCVDFLRFDTFYDMLINSIGWVCQNSSLPCLLLLWLMVNSVNFSYFTMQHVV